MQKMAIEDAIDRALDEMPDEFEIKPFLMANRVGVKKMLLTEYNERETMEMFREEGRKEGREEERREWQQKDKEWQQEREKMLQEINRLQMKLKETNGTSGWTT